MFAAALCTGSELDGCLLGWSVFTFWGGRVELAGWVAPNPLPAAQVLLQQEDGGEPFR